MNIDKTSIVRFSDTAPNRTDDVVVVEEPLEIFIDDEPFYTTMRMPGALMTTEALGRKSHTGMPRNTW